MPYFTLHRTYNMATTKGHVVGFKKGERTWVPPECVSEATAIGAIPEDEEGVVLKDEKALPPIPEGDARDEAILEAVRLLVARNAREDFTGNGSPSIDAVKELVGFHVEKRERDAAWTKYLQTAGQPADA